MGLGAVRTGVFHRPTQGSPDNRQSQRVCRGPISREYLPPILCLDVTAGQPGITKRLAYLNEKAEAGFERGQQQCCDGSRSSTLNSLRRCHTKETRTDWREADRKSRWLRSAWGCVYVALQKAFSSMKVVSNPKVVRTNWKYMPLLLPNLFPHK